MRERGRGGHSSSSGSRGLLVRPSALALCRAALSLRLNWSLETWRDWNLGEGGEML